MIKSSQGPLKVVMLGDGIINNQLKDVLERHQLSSDIHRMNLIIYRRPHKAATIKKNRFNYKMELL